MFVAVSLRVDAVVVSMSCCAYVTVGEVYRRLERVDERVIRDQGVEDGMTFALSRVSMVNVYRSVCIVTLVLPILSVMCFRHMDEDEGAIN